jgi:hypothetical protein
MRRLKGDGVELLIATPDTALALHKRSALGIDELVGVLLAWPESWEDQASLAPLMQDLSKDAQRIILTASGAGAGELVERYARRALTLGGQEGPAPEPVGPHRQASWSGGGGCRTGRATRPGVIVVWNADRSHHEDRPLRRGRRRQVVWRRAAPALVVAFDPPAPSACALLTAGESFLATGRDGLPDGRRARPVRLPGFGSVTTEAGARQAAIVRRWRRSADSPPLPGAAVRAARSVRSRRRFMCRPRRAACLRPCRIRRSPVGGKRRHRQRSDGGTTKNRYDRRRSRVGCATPFRWVDSGAGYRAAAAALSAAIAGSGSCPSDRGAAAGQATRYPPATPCASGPAPERRPPERGDGGPGVMGFPVGAHQGCPGAGLEMTEAGDTTFPPVQLRDDRLRRLKLGDLGSWPAVTPAFGDVSTSSCLFLGTVRGAGATIWRERGDGRGDDWRGPNRLRADGRRRRRASARRHRSWRGCAR